MTENGTPHESTSDEGTRHGGSPGGGRRRVIWASAGVVALALIGGGIYYATDDGRSLASACDGLLDTSELTDLLGADRLRGEGRIRRTARCPIRVRAPLRSRWRSPGATPPRGCSAPCGEPTRTSAER